MFDGDSGGWSDILPYFWRKLNSAPNRKFQKIVRMRRNSGPTAEKRNHAKGHSAAALSGNRTMCLDAFTGTEELRGTSLHSSQADLEFFLLRIRRNTSRSQARRYL
jgi:hypothetical protein